MGILNLTPDSFYDGYELSNDNIIQKFKKVSISDIIDIGAESSRPGSKPLSEKEELNRITRFLNLNVNHECLSIDSYKNNVIEFCLKNGFNMINDISGGGNEFENIDTAAKYNVPIVLMHMKGNPQNMQKKPFYKNVIEELLYFFEKKINICREIGLSSNQIIIDPGIGFGKTIKDNYRIINNLNRFKIFGFPVLIGISRKSFLSFNNDNVSDRLASSLGVSILAVINGADIIRTHDINETYSMFNVLSSIKKTKNQNVAL